MEAWLVEDGFAQREAKNQYPCSSASGDRALPGPSGGYFVTHRLGGFARTQTSDRWLRLKPGGPRVNGSLEEFQHFQLL